MAAPKNIDHMGCTLRIASFIPGLRCSGHDTRVMAHPDKVGGKGMATKPNDLSASCGCFECHRLLDQPSPEEAAILMKYAAAVEHRLRSAVDETQRFLVWEGIIQIPDGSLVHA